MQPVKELILPRQGGAILDRLLVELPISYIHLECTLFLLDKQVWGSIGLTLVRIQPVPNNSSRCLWTSLSSSGLIL